VRNGRESDASDFAMMRFVLAEPHWSLCNNLRARLSSRTHLSSMIGREGAESGVASAEEQKPSKCYEYTLFIFHRLINSIGYQMACWINGLGFFILNRFESRL
jgi:hypothetical protein